jgi:hypothetical protein
MMPSAINDFPKATTRDSPKPEPQLYNVRETPFQGKQQSFEGSYDATSSETAIVIDNGMPIVKILLLAKLTTTKAQAPQKQGGLLTKLHG